MFVLRIDGTGYNTLSFKFKTMEEAAVFLDTCFCSSENEIEITITKEKRHEIIGETNSNSDED